MSSRYDTPADDDVWVEDGPEPDGEYIDDDVEDLIDVYLTLDIIQRREFHEQLAIELAQNREGSLVIYDR